MCSVAACTSPRPTSARLSSNDTGCKWVIKHRNDVAQASFSLVPQRFTEVFSESGKMRHFTPIVHYQFLLAGTLGCPRHSINTFLI